MLLPFLSLPTYSCCSQTATHTWINHPQCLLYGFENTFPLRLCLSKAMQSIHWLVHVYPWITLSRKKARARGFFFRSTEWIKCPIPFFFFFFQQAGDTSMCKERTNSSYVWKVKGRMKIMITMTVLMAAAALQLKERSTESGICIDKNVKKAVFCSVVRSGMSFWNGSRAKVGSKVGFLYSHASSTENHNIKKIMTQ